MPAIAADVAAPIRKECEVYRESCMPTKARDRFKIAVNWERVMGVPSKWERKWIWWWGLSRKYCEAARTGHKMPPFETVGMQITQPFPYWSVLEKRTWSSTTLPEGRCRRVTSQRLKGEFALRVGAVSSPTRMKPKNAKRNATRNSNASKWLTQTECKAGIINAENIKCDGATCVTAVVSPPTTVQQPFSDKMLGYVRQTVQT